MLADREEPLRLEAENDAMDAEIRVIEQAEREAERLAREAEREEAEKAEREEAAEAERAEAERAEREKAEKAEAMRAEAEKAEIKGSPVEEEAEEGTAGGEGGAHTKMDVEKDEDNGTTPVATAMVVEIVVAATATSDGPTATGGGSGDATGVLVLASAVLPPRSAALEAIDRALPKLASRLKLPVADLEWYDGFVAEGAPEALERLLALQGRPASVIT